MRGSPGCHRASSWTPFSPTATEALQIEEERAGSSSLRAVWMHLRPRSRRYQGHRAGSVPLTRFWCTVEVLSIERDQRVGRAVCARAISTVLGPDARFLSVPGIRGSTDEASRRLGYFYSDVLAVMRIYRDVNIMHYGSRTNDAAIGIAWIGPRMNEDTLLASLFIR